MSSEDPCEDAPTGESWGTMQPSGSWGTSTEGDTQHDSTNNETDSWGAELPEASGAWNDASGDDVTAPAETANVAADGANADEDDGKSQKKARFPGTVDCFLFMNGERLPGYHLDHIRRVAQGVEPGLHTTVVPHIGANSETTLSVYFQLRDGEKNHLVAICNVAVAQLPQLMTADQFTVTEDFVNDHFANVVSPQGMMANDLGDKYKQHFAEMDPAAPLVDYMAHDFSNAIRINMEATGSSVTILFPQRFWKQVDSLPADGQKIAWSIRYLLSSLQPKTSFTWWLLFPEPKDSDWKTRWQALLTPDLRRNPYALIAKDARRGSPNDLYYDNINLETIERPDPRHTPAVNVFCSRDERTVSLLGGAADEGRWLLTKGLECESTKLPAYVLPLPGSEWKSQKSDDELYGIRGTGFPTAFLVSVPLDSVEDRDILPDVGTRVQMYTTLKQHRHSAPLRRVTATQAATMTTALCEGLAVAENRAYNALRDAERKLAKMKEQEAEDEDGDDIAEQEELVAGIHEQKFLDVAAPKILSYIATFSSEADREIPDAEPDVKRLYDAYNYAKELRRQDSEDEIEHRTRVML